MMGERTVMQEALFYGFSLERHVPDDHMLRSIDRFVDLSDVRAHLEPFYSAMGRPSIDPELMIRMLLVGYCFGIRSERRLCEEVHLNLAYRWFCRLGLDSEVPDHSTFSKNRHGRFRESDLLRQVFETVVARCMAEGLVGGEGFAVDASMIAADAHRQRGVARAGALDPRSNRAVAEYLAVLNDAAFGGATRASRSRLPDRSRRPLRRGANRCLLRLCRQLSDRSEACGDHGRGSDDRHASGRGHGGQDDDRPHGRAVRRPAHALAADTGYGSAEMLAWLVDERGIEPHIPVFDKSGRKDGTFSRSDFAYDHEGDVYICPGGKELKIYHRNYSKPRECMTKDGRSSIRASKYDCDACELKPDVARTARPQVPRSNP